MFGEVQTEKETLSTNKSIDLFVLKVSFSVCTSPNIQDETLFLRFKIFLSNFGA